MDRLSGRDLAAALAIVFIWGLNFVAMKYALHDFTPFQLGAARFAFAALPLVLLVKPPGCTGNGCSSTDCSRA